MLFVVDGHHDLGVVAQREQRDAAPLGDPPLADVATRAPAEEGALDPDQGPRLHDVETGGGAFGGGCPG